jgi:predicted MFS family arabinose efflux permease
MNSKEYQMIKGSSIKLRLFIGAFLLLVFALGFNAMLTLSSLEQLYIESFVSQYSTVGKDLQRRLEKSLSFGKSIEKFVGMDELLKETNENLKKIGDENKGLNDVSVSVAVSDGQILYSTDETLKNTIRPQTKTFKTASQYTKYKNRYIIPLAVSSSLKKEQAATILISFDEKPITRLFRTVLIRNCKRITAIIAGASLFLLLSFMLILRNSDSRNFSKTKISIVMLIIIGISQMIFTGLNTNSFADYYLQISRDKITLLGNLLKQNIEYLLNKGIRADKLIKMDAMLGELIAAAPELDNIIIADVRGNQLYAASKNNGNFDFQNKNIKALSRLESDPDYSISLRFQRTEDSSPESEYYRGKIFANISKEVLFSRLKEIALDSLTIVVISFLFFFEMMILIFQLIQSHSTILSTEKTTHYSEIRPAAFVFLFATFIGSSFLPMYTGELYRNSKAILGLSEKIMMGLPLCSEMLFVGLAIIAGGLIIDKKGWHVAFFVGAFISVIGSVLSGIPDDVVEFIIYRGILGFGYGLAWLSFQGYVISSSEDSNRGKGLSNLVAGIFSGSICGGAVGGMLSERIGYAAVFFIGAFLIIISIILVIVFMKGKDSLKKNKLRLQHESISLTPSLILKFIFDRNIFSTLIFSSIPASLCFVSVMYYFTPLYLRSINTSQANIGRVLMVYGLFMIFIAPFITSRLARSPHQRAYITLSGFIGGVGLMSFVLFKGFFAVFLVILMLSLSNSIGFTLRVVHILNTKDAKVLGEGKALGIYRSSERIGQIIGPLVFGVIISHVGFENGIISIGAVYLILTLLFIFGSNYPHRSL